MVLFPFHCPSSVRNHIELQYKNDTATTFTFVAGGLELVTFDVSRCWLPASIDIAVSTLLAFASHLSGAFGWPSSDGAILDLLIDDIDDTKKKKNLH